MSTMTLTRPTKIMGIAGIHAAPAMRRTRTRTRSRTRTRTGHGGGHGGHGHH